MTAPTIQILGIMQPWSPTRWNASGDVDGVGWLDAWGTSLIDAMQALQALAAQWVVPPPMHAIGDVHEEDAPP